jgi:crossover junction endonuclease MUS81
MLNKHIEAKNITNLDVSLVNLECGDFVIQHEEIPVTIIERKTLTDLVASIKDQRYKKQKIKMLETYGKEKILYIIEGSFDFCSESPLYIEGMEKRIVLSSIINTMIRDGIKVVNTSNITDTCNFLTETILRLSKDPMKYINGGSLTQNTYNEVPLIKKKILTKQDLFLQQISQIPGISHKTAHAFLIEFNDMFTFYSQLSCLNAEEKLKILKNITTTENNKVRRISSKVADNILKYMF